MFRIRFHGRGGQGMKTASRILGTAFFLEGYEVQDAPRYGAERRGAPIFAYVRAAKTEIHERGIISHPDLVVVADDTLVPVPAAGVLQGLEPDTVLLINSGDDAETWKQRLNIASRVVILPITEDVEDRNEMRYIGATCAGAAARLTGVISIDSLTRAIEQELGKLGPDVVAKNIEKARTAWDLAPGETGLQVHEARKISAADYQKPDLIDLPFESADISAPVIHGGLTSFEVNTGLWRTMRPVIDFDRCVSCWWVCSSYCPDSCIAVVDNKPEIDYDHCKGCLVCVAVCPPHAIEAVAESQFQTDKTGAGS